MVMPKTPKTSGPKPQEASDPRHLLFNLIFYWS
jgi:hypothetical protein